MKKENEEKKEKLSTQDNIKDWIITIVIFVVAFVVIRTFIGQPVVTNGESMSPTLVHGDMVFVEKVTTRLGSLEQGDVIVFPYPADPSKEYIKRVIGVPGDEIDFIDYEFYINGEKFDDPFVLKGSIIGDTVFPLTVGEDEYFVLGDNRAVSHDSRHSEVGLINEKDVDGRALFVFYPFNRIKLVK